MSCEDTHTINFSFIYTLRVIFFGFSQWHILTKNTINWRKTWVINKILGRIRMEQQKSSRHRLTIKIEHSQHYRWWYVFKLELIFKLTTNSTNFSAPLWWRVINLHKQFIPLRIIRHLSWQQNHLIRENKDQIESQTDHRDQ